MERSAKIIPYIILALIGLILFVPFIGDFHLFDWDEINFAESSREMLVSGNFFQVQINYEPFQEKPPLFFWLQALSMKIFGVSEFSARLPNSIFGVLSLLILFRIGSKLKNSRFGWIWALIYLGSLLPHLYYKSGIIDPVFNLFIFLGVYFFIRWVSDQKIQQRNLCSMLSGLFIGFAIITKGPVGFLLLFLTVIVYWLLKRQKRFFSIKEVMIFGVSALFVSCFWFGHETIKNGPWFLIEFVKYQIELFSEPVAGHQQPFYYHFVVVLFGCMPMSFIALPRFFKQSETDALSFERWMKVLFWVVLILFTIVSTKIVHYSSMTYLPLSYLAALQLNNWNSSTSKWLNVLLIVVGSLISVVLFLIPFLAHFHLNYLQGLIADKFFSAQLVLDANWFGFEWMIALVYGISVLFFVYLLNKRNIILSLVVLVIGLGSTILLLGKYVLPKVEIYSQGPAIDFYESIQNENVYITTVGYKSYAQYYYTKINALAESDALYDQKIKAKEIVLQKHSAFNHLAAKQYNSILLEWLKNGAIDKPVYFVSRIDRNHLLDSNKNISFLYQKGGFVFYKRNP